MQTFNDKKTKTAGTEVCLGKVPNFSKESAVERKCTTSIVLLRNSEIRE